MPFADDPTKRPLYDRHNGGGPSAWRCLLCPDAKMGVGPGGIKVYTGKVTRTLAGMKQHQLRVHGFKEQAELWPDKKNDRPAA